jgi:thioredoxin reductase
MLETAIIGAGPYGLSIAAHFRKRGIPFRIFGRPMDTWFNHMPKGMMLKSDGFASNLYDPESEYTLRHFCAERGIEYGDTGIPVRLDTFNAYGLAFQSRMVPDLEQKTVTGVERATRGFRLLLEDGEIVAAERVILAVGITHFEHIPSGLTNLPAEFLSHSARHSDVTPWRGRSVVVIGGGASGLDMAGLLHEAGADVQLVGRQKALKFHTAPSGRPRSMWQQIRHPKSGLGPGLRSRIFSDAPWAFRYLPESVRLEIVRKALGPSGGWFIRDKVTGKVPLHLGYNPEGAEVENGKVRLHLRSADGSTHDILTEHIICATGYKVDLSRLGFVSSEIRSQLKSVEGAPVLSSRFESSVPGLYFVGIAAANTFGPVMRFAFGAGFAAQRLTQTMARVVAQSPASVPVARAAATTK